MRALARGELAVGDAEDLSDIQGAIVGEVEMDFAVLAVHGRGPDLFHVGLRTLAVGRPHLAHHTYSALAE